MPEMIGTAGAAGTRRIGFVLGVSVVGALYAIFLVGTICIAIRYLPPWQNTDQWLLHTDFARMWYVGRRLLADWNIRPQPGLLLGGDILAPSTLRTATWLYPPTTGLVAMLFALPPVSWGFWLWRAGCALFGYWLLRRAGLPRFPVILGLAGPAALLDFCGGQIGTLTGALLVGALLLAERSPRGAGICAGFLAIKPDIAVLLPFAWARGRLRTAYLAAAATVFTFLLVSWLVEGNAAWDRFFTVGLPASWAITKEPLSMVPQEEGFTVNFLLRSLGAQTPWAPFGQDIVSFLAIAGVWLAWTKERMLNCPRMVLTVCLSVLAMPYGYAYCLVSYSVAMMVLAFRLSGVPAFFAALLWLMGGYTVLVYHLTGLLLFPVCALLGAVLAWAVRADAVWGQGVEEALLE